MMGIVYVEGLVRAAEDASLPTRTVRFLVDSGASYSLLPDPIWRELGLTRKRRLDFVLADGTKLERDVSECYIEVAGGSGHSPVILGEPGDEPLLGVITLEVLGLVLDPFKRTLRQAVLRLS